MAAADVHVALVLTGALGAGLIAGVLFAFSAFVMRALDRLPAEQGLAAMQSINNVVINPVFLGVFIGMTIFSALAILFAGMHRETPGAMYLLIGGIAYLFGTFGITVTCNVPLNDSLAKVEPGDTDAETKWKEYVRRWTRWNHLRTLAAIVATAMYVMAIRS